MRVSLLALALPCSALVVTTPPRSHADGMLSKPTRRSFLLALPALAAAPTTASAAATGTDCTIAAILLDLRTFTP